MVCDFSYNIFISIQVIYIFSPLSVLCSLVWSLQEAGTRMESGCSISVPSSCEGGPGGLHSLPECGFRVPRQRIPNTHIVCFDTWNLIHLLFDMYLTSSFTIFCFIEHQHEKWRNFPLQGRKDSRSPGRLCRTNGSSPHSSNWGFNNHESQDPVETTFLSLCRR